MVTMVTMVRFFIGNNRWCISQHYCFSKTISKKFLEYSCMTKNKEYCISNTNFFFELIKWKAINSSVYIRFTIFNDFWNCRENAFLIKDRFKNMSKQNAMIAIFKIIEICAMKRSVRSFGAYVRSSHLISLVRVRS